MTKKLFKISLLILALALILPLVASCGTNPQEQGEETTTKKEEVTTVAVDEKDLEAKSIILSNLENIANTAFTNLETHFWDEKNGYMIDPYKDGVGRTIYSDIFWAYVQAMLSMETYYLATGNQDCKEYMVKTLEKVMAKDTSFLFQCGGGNNPCADDGAWSALGFMLYYRLTGNKKGLEYAHDMIEAAYDYWQDGDTAHGLWYNSTSFGENGERAKSTYNTGFILAELEYYAATKGTEMEDLELHERTMDLYNWTENNMRRDKVLYANGVSIGNVIDNLYYCDYMEVTRSGAVWYGNRSSLFGNCGMATVNKRLYDLTGEVRYLNKAVATANGLLQSGLINGCLNNDADAWTNCAFLGFFVREVMPLDGVDAELGNVFLTTVKTIMETQYYEGGFYGSDWGNEGRWTLAYEVNGNPYWMDNSTTTMHILFATYYMVKENIITVKASQKNMLKSSYTPKDDPYHRYKGY